MLKLNASYSKKIPVDGTDYSSHSYLASVEVEIPDGLTSEQLQAKIHDTFELVRNSVEDELHGSQPDNGRRNDNGNANVKPFPRRNSAGRGNARNIDTPASAAQLKYLSDLAIRQGMSIRDLETEASRSFKVNRLEDLSKNEASKLIDRLSVNDNTGRKAA